MLSSAHTRQWLSPLVTVLFTAITLTGILMWLELRVAGVKSLHEVSGIAFALVGLAHIVSNWKVLLAYFRKPKGWVTLVAGGLVCLALLAAGAIGGEGREGGPAREGRGRYGRH